MARCPPSLGGASGQLRSHNLDLEGPRNTEHAFLRAFTASQPTRISVPNTSAGLCAGVAPSALTFREGLGGAVSFRRPPTGPSAQVVAGRLLVGTDPRPHRAAGEHE